MRLLGALVLLLQLQPFVGSALCFHVAELATSECAMPSEDRSVAPTLAAVDGVLPAGCAGAAYCAPGAPAVIKFAHTIRSAPVIHGAPALVDASLAPGDPLAPPFHPPRA